ncbi:XdhC family protein [Burkholderia contaminans]|uniref:XdhC family protein n=2 Tax=Burkholderia contaminans TaxID=488447 RepID=UPI0028932B86|nr:XdhC family protein [Burkholderia contaminans]
MDRDVLETAIMWHCAGPAVMLGTVLKTWGSAPRPIGAMVALRDDGAVKGSVSGGCLEDDLIERVWRVGFSGPTRPCNLWPLGRRRASLRSSVRRHADGFRGIGPDIVTPGRGAGMGQAWPGGDPERERQ